MIAGVLNRRQREIGVEKVELRLNAAVKNTTGR